MIVRRLKREELMDAARIRAISFHGTLNEEAVQKTINEMAGEDGINELHQRRINQNWGCFDEDGTLMACIINNDFTIRFDGHLVRMGGIGGVATLPEYRYGGAVKTIFASLLRKAREEGEVFSSLYPFSHEFYRKVGYEQFLPVVEYEFPPSLVSGLKHTSWTKRIEVGGDTAPIKEIYAAFAQRYNFMLDRPEERYRIGNPYKDGQFTMLLGDERGARAYLYYQTDKHDGQNILDIRDIAFKDAEGFRMCLGYLGRMSADYASIKMALPDDIPLLSMVPRPYDVTPRFRQQPMARITNAEKALALMKKPDGASFTIQVTDDFLPENSGTYRVTTEGVSRTEERADLEVSSHALTLLVLGAVDLAQAEYRTDVRINQNRETLGKTFIRKPLFIADYF